MLNSVIVWLTYESGKGVAYATVETSDWQRNFPINNVNDVKALIDKYGGKTGGRFAAVHGRLNVKAPQIAGISYQPILQKIYPGLDGIRTMRQEGASVYNAIMSKLSALNKDAVERARKREQTVREIRNNLSESQFRNSSENVRNFFQQKKRILNSINEYKQLVLKDPNSKTWETDPISHIGGLVDASITLKSLQKQLGQIESELQKRRTIEPVTDREAYKRICESIGKRYRMDLVY